MPLRSSILSEMFSWCEYWHGGQLCGAGIYWCDILTWGSNDMGDLVTWGSNDMVIQWWGNPVMRWGIQRHASLVHVLSVQRWSYVSATESKESVLRNLLLTGEDHVYGYSTAPSAVVSKVWWNLICAMQETKIGCIPHTKSNTLTLFRQTKLLF